MSHKQSTVLVHNLNEPTNHVQETEQHFLTVEAKFAMTLISVAFMDPPKKTENVSYFLESEKLPNKKTALNKLRANTIEFYEALSFQLSMFGDGKLEPVLLTVILKQFSEKKNKEKEIGIASFNVSEHAPLDLFRTMNFVQCDVLFSSGKKHDNIMIKVDIMCSLIRLKKGNDCYYVDKDKNQMVIGEFFADSIAATDYLNDEDSGEEKKKKKSRSTDRKSIFVRKKIKKGNSSSEEDINIEVAKTVANAIDENFDLEKEKHARNQEEIEEYKYNLLPEELKGKYRPKQSVDLTSIVSAMNERDREIVGDDKNDIKSPRSKNDGKNSTLRTLKIEKPSKKKIEKVKSKKGREKDASKEAQIEYLKKQNESLLSQIKIFHEHENDKRKEIMEKLTKVILQAITPKPLEQDEVEQSVMEVIPVVSLGLLDLFENQKEDKVNVLETPLGKMVNNLTGDATVDRLAALELLYNELPDEDGTAYMGDSNEYSDKDDTYYEALRELEEIEQSVKYGETVIDAEEWADLPENAALYAGINPIRQAMSHFSYQQGPYDQSNAQANSNLDLENYDDFEAFLNDFTKMDEEKNEFLQESDNYINELLENELELRVQIEQLQAQTESDQEIIGILKEINDEQKIVIAELEDSEANLSSLLKLKLNESDGYKSEVTEYKSRRNEVDELKKVVSERDDQILRLQSERNVFQREYNRMKLELEKASGKGNSDMVLSEYSLNAKEKKNLERQQALETQEFEFQERQIKLTALKQQIEQQEKELFDRQAAYEKDVRLQTEQLEKRRVLLSQETSLRDSKEIEHNLVEKQQKLLELTQKVENGKEEKDKLKQPTPEAKQKMNEIKNQRANKFQTLKFIKPATVISPPANKKVAKTDDVLEKIPNSRPGPKFSPPAKVPTGKSSLNKGGSMTMQSPPKAKPTENTEPAPVSPRKKITRKETIKLEIEKTKAEMAKRNVAGGTSTSTTTTANNTTESLNPTKSTTSTSSPTTPAKTTVTSSTSTSNITTSNGSVSSPRRSKSHQKVPSGSVVTAGESDKKSKSKDKNSSVKTS